MHYLENVIIPINKKSDCFFLKERNEENEEKWTTQ